MNRTTLMTRTRRSRPLLALAAVGLLAACEGENLFQALPTQSGSGGRADPTAPQVRIESPDSTRRVAVQDSVLVRVRVTDNQALASLQLSGFALRGSAALGTESRVERFVTKLIQFDSASTVRDTVITRYLIASADTLPEDSIFLVAIARDTVGNTTADTVRISIGGPRVQLLAPLNGSDVRAGTSLRVRVAASDPARLETIVVRATGGATASATLELDPPAARVDTFLTLPIPSNARGDLVLQAVVRSTSNDSATSSPITLRVLAPIQDRLAPTVRFNIAAPQRAERDDSVSVTVLAVDSTQILQTGVTVVPIHRLSTRTDTLTPITLTSPLGETTFSFPLTQVGLPEPTDTSTLRLEITAFARDTAGNCAAATVPNTAVSETCRVELGRTFSTRSGSRVDVLAVRGTTVALEGRSDVIADIASDGQRVFLSNLTRNRLDVIPVSEPRITATVSVGARPWGLAFNRARSRLYVANSGGTNISIVSPSGLNEVERILTPNVKLFDVTYEPKLYLNPDTSAAAPDSLLGYFPSSVRGYDYSDRPQFIGVTQNENLIYSTLPTGAAPDGTIRIWRTAQKRLQIVTEYAERRLAGKLIIAHADSAFLVAARPSSLIEVCPRARSADPTREPLPRICVTGDVLFVQDSLRRAGYDTEFLYNRDIAEIGLSDTTFVAVSGDHSTVAFGEGATGNARVMVLAEGAGDAATSPLLKSGEIRDIVGNTAERVIGLSLNRDGSLGVARGEEAYFFDRDLRLQGTVGTGQQSGGVDMHPANPDQRRTFVSGVEENGLAYIDVIDSFHFRRIGRIFMRDVVTGPIRAVPLSNGALRIYAVTARGVVVVDVLARDLS